MIVQDRVSQSSHNSRQKSLVPMKQPTTEGFDLSNRDNLSDDTERITTTIIGNHTAIENYVSRTRLMLPIRTMSAVPPHQSSSRSSSPWQHRRFRSLPRASDVRNLLVVYYLNTARRACPSR